MENALGDFSAGILFSGWRLLQSTQIVDARKSENWSYVLVKNFPITDQSKILWWENNKSILISKYNIPTPNDKESFTIVICDIGEGYKQEVPKQDWMAPSVDTSYLICFYDIEGNINCIEKDSLLSISRHRDSRHQDKMVTGLSIDNNTYRQYDKNKEAIKIDNDEDATYY